MNAPGTITYRLEGICPGRVVTLVCPLDADATFKRDDELTPHTAKSRRYPAIITEIKTRYRANALGPCHLSPSAA